MDTLILLVQQLFTNIQDLMIQIKYLIILKNNYYLFVEIAYIYIYICI